MKLLKFNASWGVLCKMQTQEFKEHPIDADVEEIDIDNDECNLATEHHVKHAPTMILLDDKGETIHRWVGFIKSEEINGTINNLRSTRAAEGE